jgi:alkanesulfonate monooxygenase SsuD/methylene tetrahydromethanopterin reductase-like flavin-dependent oxidoreductase (luciferase family)
VRVIARMACVVSDDPAEWRAAATHVAMSIVRRSASILDEEDYEAAGRIRESYSSAGHLELETEYTEHVTERLLRKMALVGTSAEVRERVEGLAALGVDQLDIIPAGREPVRVLETFARAMGL